MKNIIIIIGTMVLAGLIFNMMVGEGTAGAPSLREASESAFTTAVHQFE